LPTGAERGDAQGAKQFLARMTWEVEQRTQLRHGHLFRTRRELEDLLARLYLALLEHAEVEPRAMVRDEQSRNARVVHPDPDSVARNARLRDLEDGATDLVAVADADFVVGQPFDREVLAELSIDEVVSPKLSFPVAVGVPLVDEDGTLLATVPGKIALPVAVDVELAHSTSAAHRVLVDARENRLASPGHVLGHADVDRQQRARRIGVRPARLCLRRLRVPNT
jgi:hypothetical protein